MLGELKALIIEGKYTDDNLDTYGGYGVIEIPNLQDILQLLCKEGFVHHVAASLNSIGDIVFEALSNHMGYNIVYPNKSI